MRRNDQHRHSRRSIRLRGYDYTQVGAYFVTLCTWQRECLFGEVVEGVMRLSPTGRIIEVEWQRLGYHFPHICLDAFVVMPNHLHGIIVVNDPGMRPNGPPAGSLGAMIGQFKSRATKRIWARSENERAPIWQRNYYEHIIRDEADLRRIREYIQNNAARWDQDQLHPAAPPNRFIQGKQDG